MIIELISKLGSVGIKLWVEDKQLKFKAPKGALTPELKTELIANKAEVIEFLSQTTSKKSEIKKSLNRDALPLSFAQKRLWFLDQLEEGESITYHMPSLIKLEGKLNKEYLYKALHTIIERHEVLRTNFINKDEITTQVIGSADRFSLEEISCDEGSLKKQVEVSLAKAFDLSSDLLFRANLYTITSSKSYLLVNMHHIISDGWSIAVLIKEFISLYTALMNNQENPLPALAIQYADYSLWQNDELSGTVLKQKLDFWKDELEGAENLELPTSFPRPIEPSHKGSSINFELDEALLQKLNLLNQKHDVTLFMSLLSSFSTLLHRYSHQDDIVIGTPIANRNRSELEGLIGLFVNTLVMRQDYSSNPNFKDLLTQVKEKTLNAYGQQDVPFEKIVDFLNIPRDPSRSPLFQVMFVLQNNENVKIELPELSIMTQDLQNDVSKFDLTLTLSEVDNKLQGSIEYANELFSKDYIASMIENFKVLLKAITQDEMKVVSDYALITPSQENEQINIYNQTHSDYDKTKTIQQVFEEQVQTSPTNIAVVYENQELSYEDLNTKANQLAHYLIEEGLKADDLVAVFVERSIDMVIGLLAVLKAGGAYVPIDPSYPSDRIQYMMDDSKAKILLTQTSLEVNLPQTQAQIMCIDTLSTSSYKTTNPITQTSSKNLAYVIYTSGSTGKPKGVMIEHSGVINLSAAQVSSFDLTSDDNILQFASFGFDAASWEVVMALLSGASLVLVKKEVMSDAQALERYINDKKVSVATIPPVMLALLNSDNLKTLRIIISAGEACSQSLVNEFSINRNFFNAYGPTESSVCASMYLCSANEKNMPPIGRPINNTQLYILDKNNRLLPKGVPGELHIAGDGLARGYLHKPDLTDEKFITNPFTQGEKMYKSGDLVRYAQDGNIEYLGRIDDQVKIRGFRIELGEIEQALLNINFINEAVVLAKENEAGHKRLVAYICAEDTLDLNTIKPTLLEHLPEYMVPSAITKIDLMPLTPNGKINKKALLKLEVEISSSQDFIAPRNEIEETLASVFSAVLNVQKVGVYDNFFELGGDSILSIQIVSRAKQAGLIMQVKDIFAHQNIDALSKVVNSTGIETLCEQGKVEGKIDLNPIQEWFFEENFEDINHWNQAVLLEIDKSIEGPVIDKAVKAIEDKHDALRLRFDKDVSHTNASNVVVQELSVNANTSEDLGQTISNICNEHHASLSIDNGPIWKVLLIKTPELEQKNRIFIVAHHLIIDGVSWRILLEDLVKSIISLKAGQSIDLGMKTSSFKDYTASLKDLSNTKAFSKDLLYWQEVMNKEVNALPKDFDKAEVDTASTKTISMSLDKELTSSLLNKVNQTYNTQINDILLTALALSLQEWTDENTFRINMEGHGRDEIDEKIDLTQSIGWFTSKYPVLLSLESENSLSSSIKNIKEQLRKIASKGVSYGMLRYLHEDTKVQDSLKSEVPIEVVFNYLGQFDNVLAGNDLVSTASEDSGFSIAGKNHRISLLDINGSIMNGSLSMGFSYSCEQFKEGTIRALTQSFHKHLQKLILHCSETKQRAYTPSDFPLASLSQVELDEQVLKKIDQNNIESIYPLTSLQSGMLFHSLHDNESQAYTEEMICDFKNDINVQAFEKAWDYLINKHSILRTSFVYEGLTTPHQVVFKDIKTPLFYKDISTLDKEEQDKLIKKQARIKRARGFDLRDAPLMHISLMKRSNTLYSFVLHHHHILMDGWSLPIVVQGLMMAYQSFSNNETMPLVVDKYENFLEYLSHYDEEKAKDYWTEYLSGMDSPTQINVKRALSQSSTKKSKYLEENNDLSLSKTQDLEAFAKNHHITMNTLVQGAWALVLQRYSGAKDVLFGIVNAGRPADMQGVEHSVGLFINTLPLRVAYDKNTNTLQWLKNLQEQQLQMREFEYSSIGDIQSYSSIANNQALFESIMVYENYPLGDMADKKEAPLIIDNLSVHEETNYALSLMASTSDVLSLKISFDEKYYEKSVINRMMNHLNIILDAFMQTADKGLGHINILSQEEEVEQLIVYNQTKMAYDKTKTIHQLFEEQVLKTPTNTAVVYEDEKLSYEELNVKANALAHYLIKQGIQADDLVAICVERSLEMMVGLLAILKAGGAYVPVDPSYPSDRIEYMLIDSKAKIFLTQTSLQDKMPQTNCQQIALDSLDTDIYETNNPMTQTNASHLAYVIYTSGTTGKPKGVMLEHRGVANLSKAQIDSFSITQSDRIMQFASFGFDAASWEIVMALLSGASLYLTKQEVVSDALALENFLIQKSISVITLPPVMLALLEAIKLKDLRVVISAGEACSLSILQKFSENRNFFNAYGPTENSVCASVYLCSGDETTLPPIGKAIYNNQLYILDKNNCLVAKGVPGELHISGDGLARGYLNKPELTDEKFIPNIFIPNTKMYKTGDLVKYLEDGNIEYLGRIDDQVKIRGFRIELGEIEQELLNIKTIKESVVLAKVDETGNKRLVAYITTKENKDVDLRNLKSTLSQHLPEYMVPSAILSLNLMPLTPNGKVDKKALLKLDVLITSKEEYIAPRDEMEKHLAKTFSQVLNIEKIGIHDNFFELGGHSLLATGLVSKIRTELQVELPLKELFVNATVQGLAQYLSHKAKKSTLSVIPVLKDKTNLVLSFAQERLWFLDQLEGNDSGTYHIPGLLKLEGKLNKEALKDALFTIVQRHEALRTNFINKEALPVQVVGSANRFSLETFICKENELEDKVKTSLSKGFNLSVDLLFRADLYTINKTKNYLLINMHHIISDGWSIGVLIKEFLTLYNAYTNSEENSLSPLTLQYADYSAWQKEYLSGDVLSEKLNFWKGELEGAATLELPTSYSRPSAPSYKGSTLNFEIDESLTNKLYLLNQKHDVTLFMSLLSSFSVLLHRYSQQDDIVIGTPIANRNRSEVEDLIGFFVNTLVMRQDYSNQPSFSELLEQVKTRTLNAYEQQDVPFEKIVDFLNIPRDASRSPLFQVMFVLQNNENVSLNLPELSISAQDLEHDIAKFDLTMNISEVDNTLQGSIEYSTDLFSKEYISAMIENFKVLLTHITEDESKDVSKFTLLTPSQETEQLSVYNQISVAYKKTNTIHELFEAQVLLTPNNIAVVYENQELSYAQLNNKANALAHYLIEEGVKAEDLVGICVDRSIEMMVGLLAILKAGGAYVPIDPSYPSDRITYILEDSNAKILLTQNALLQDLPKCDKKQICIDTLDLQAYATNNPSAQTSPSDLAYVIYTSGTTGRPKGVMLEHHNVDRLFKSVEDKFNFNASDVWTLFHSFAFDFAVWEMWGALIYGAKLVIVPFNTSRSPEEFYALLKKEKVSILNQTPAAFKQLIEIDRQKDEKLSSLRQIIFGGDKLDFISLSSWYDKYNDTKPQLINMYGITETTVHTTYSAVRKEDTLLEESIIGTTLPDLGGYILDKNNQLVPKGVPGEFHIVGDGLARGYLNQPDLTAEKFIENPFIPNTRMYKTGDLVKYIEDGNVEYLGRIDDQVKIRGFRIELGEIEQQLLNIKTIKEAVVLAKADETGNKKLVAYIVSKDNQDLESQNIKMTLGENLPEYMIPSVFTLLDIMPLTSNAKIDKKALLKIKVDISSSQKYVAARDERETTLAQIFAEVLNVKKVGIYDNFFELGGHSLLATVLVSKIRKELLVELPLKELFVNASVQGLAQYIKENGVKTTLSSIPVLEDKNNVPLSFAQERLWFLDQLEEGNSSTYHMPGLLRLEGTLNLKALTLALETIIQRHEALRTNFITIDEVSSQVIRSIDDFMINMTECTQENLENQVKQSLSRGFNLKKDLLFRADLYTISDTQNYLLINMHHIISDGWSMGVLTKEFVSLYTAYTNSEENPLSPLSIQYADYAAWQKEYLSGDLLNEKLSFWKDELEGAQTLELPTSHLRPTKPSYKGDTISFEISETITNSLYKLNQKHGATLFMTLLSSFSLLLHRYSQQDDIVIGTPIANRNRSEVEDLIGFFINTLVMRQDYASKPNFTQLLDQVKTRTLKAYEQQDVPFEKIVDFLNIPRDASRSPLFQVMFVLQNNENVAINLPELSISTQTLESNISKFDLTMNISEVGNTLHGSIEYSTDLFSKDYITSMIENFKVLLTSITEDETKTVTDYALLTQGQETQQILDYTQTKVPYDKTKTIHDLFEAQVLLTPNNIAVVFENEKLTYNELNERANQLAHYLLAEGIEADDLVAICVERSIEMVVGLLAILKAGGAYVPVASSYPKDRIQYLIEDSKAKILLTQTSLQDNMPDTKSKQLCIDTLDTRSYAKNNPITPTSSNNLAYVIYTSGTTGKPKGVMLEHSGIVNLSKAQIDTFDISANDKIMQFASFGFDAASWEVVMALLSGASLYLTKQEIISDAIALEDFLIQKEISVITLPPVMLALLNEKKLTNLRTVISAGEACSLSIVKRFSTNRNFFNAYGPTENSVCASVYLCSGEETTLPPIGKAINNNKLYILGKNNSLVPKGVPGELHLAGDGLARGYLNKPELTKEKFIPNPFIPNTKMYKTGDLVRYLEDGNIEYLGRIDDQVKIRGFRIELGEIEQQLLNIDNIKESVVLAKVDKAGNKKLVAYITTEDKKEIELSTVKSILSEYLPEYMVPSAIITLSILPLTPNGKVDKKALDKLVVEIHSSQEYIAPRTEIEETLAAIFNEVLNVEKVGINDNFFELGGHSLLAVSLISKINKEMNIKMSLSTLFESSTIQELQEQIEKNKNKTFDILVPMQTKGSRNTLFCVPGADGNVLIFQDLVKTLGANQPVYGLQSQSLDINSPLIKDVKAIAKINIEAMQRVQPEGPYALVGHSMGGLIAFEMARLLLDKGERVESIVFLDVILPELYEDTLSKGKTELMYMGLVELVNSKGLSIGFDLDDLEKINEENQDVFIVDALKHIGFDIDLELFQSFSRTYLNNIECVSNYTTIPLNKTLDIALIKASEKNVNFPADYGWNTYLRQSIREFEVNGNHSSILDKENINELVDTMGDFYQELNVKIATIEFNEEGMKVNAK